MKQNIRKRINNSFLFATSRKGIDFWCKKIFQNENFQKIEHKLL